MKLQIALERDAFVDVEELGSIPMGTRLARRFRVRGGPLFVDVRSFFPDDDRGHRVAAGRKRVVVYHHDGVAYSGTTIEQDLERIAVVHRYHIGKGWGGTGYHFAIPPVTGLVYILGGLEESRAHVSSYARAANPGLWGTDLPNDVGVGVVWLGNFADDRDDQTGRATSVDRPTANALALYQELVEWIPNTLDRDITAVPHKVAHPNHTTCPGNWIHQTVSDVFSPTDEPDEPERPGSDHSNVIAAIDVAQAALAETRRLLA